ncbi:hypothetical protein [Bacillus phage phiAGATE]|uniref:Uncharacterized protein n=1 Tax=Bacillus phage phiAGATE TaxID=1204533 RepID=L0L8J8_9CAUD|nr:hypothetical protein G380_gp109 [Bacillus phage phiAGATE]AGB62759.1 hypothetical protein [Bacillus phage phiAGATE]
MGAFIAQQPNGLYCRFSTTVGCPTHHNMTREDYLRNVTGTIRNREDGEDILENYLYPFSIVLDRFQPNNMTQQEFDKVVQEMNIPVEELEKVKEEQEFKDWVNEVAEDVFQTDKFKALGRENDYVYQALAFLGEASHSMSLAATVLRNESSVPKDLKKKIKNYQQAFWELQDQLRECSKDNQ